MVGCTFKGQTGNTLFHIPLKLRQITTFVRRTVMNTNDVSELYQELQEDNNSSKDRNTAALEFYVLMVVVSDPGAHGPMAFFICDRSAPELGEEMDAGLTRDFRRAQRFSSFTNGPEHHWNLNRLAASLAKDNLVLHSYKVVSYTPTMSWNIDCDQIREDENG
jgi:hypothetical protein